ncbi:MAG: tetratricopeptide repeat protein [Meiothermus sp.]|nr:tetratricopeptide repeat protein [Meiothermus sp.]
MPSQTLRIQLFGSFQTSVETVSLGAEGWRRRKASDVVKLLALQPQGRLHREQVLEALWPDLEEKAAMNNLHQNLHHARRLLEPELDRGARPRFLVFEHDTVVLCARGDLEVDYISFKSLLAQARRTPQVSTYEAAVELYSGDLLPEDVYQDWTEPQRDEARTLYLEALLELAGLLEAEGSLARACHHLEAAVAKERTHEAAHLALMRIYARSGRRMEAVQQFQTLREALVQELGEEPDPATRAVYDEILQKLPDLPELLPQASADPATGGYVPAALTPLIGREEQQEEILQLLGATRSLTLTGAGGSGKTRLALELASRLQPNYPGGVWWIELTSLNDPKLILPTVAQTLGASNPSKPAFETLVEHLKGRKALLVLDNCEHLIEGCAEAAVKLLRALPGLQLLSTSREPLSIAGEIAWTMPLLEVPRLEGGLGLEELGRLESVRLLVERVRQNNPRFALTSQNAPSVVQICRRLEGLPLALELAAARVGMLTLEQIAARLDNSLSLLTRGKRGETRHHQTLEAALEWSYNLLGQAERDLFVRLSVFVGGWTFEAAETVAAETVAAENPGGRPEPGDPTELLARLERSSMVIVNQSEGAVRFRMLEPVRQFGFARLEGQGLAEAVKARVLDFYLGQAQAIAPKLSGPDQAAWYRHLSSEYENLRAVLSWSNPGRLEQGLALAASLWRFFQVKGHAKEVLAWLEEALPLAGEVSAAVRADAHNAAGIMARTCGLYAQSDRYYQTSLALRRELGHRRGEAVALNNLGVNARDQEDYARVEHYCAESLKIAREIGDRPLEALGLMNMGTALQRLGNNQAAEEHFRQGLEISSSLGDRRVMSNLLNYLGTLAKAKSDWPQARQLFEQSLSINRELDDFWGIAISAHYLAALHLERGEYPQTRQMLLESLTHYRKAGVRHGLEDGFETLARLTQQLGRPEQAAWAWGVVERLDQEIGKVDLAAPRPERQKVYAALEEALGTSFEQVKRTGYTERLEDALAKALADLAP